MNGSRMEANREIEVSVQNGWVMLGLVAVVLLVDIGLLVFQALHDSVLPALVFFVVASIIVVGLLSAGFFSLQPNEARVLILFGAYKGTVRISGFWWANPFYARARARVPLPPGSVSPEAVKAAAAKGMASSLLYRSLSSKISLRARNFN